MILNEIEKEIVVLKAINELIDSAVNFEILEIGDTDPTAIRFKSITHAKYFNIVLVDLLSTMDKKGIVKSEPYLRALASITQMPKFDVNNSVDSLAESTRAFISWLEAPFIIPKMWLPSVQIEIDLQLTRLELIKTAGNICRHNVLRSVGIAQDVVNLLKTSGASISTDQALLVLSDLYAWLHTDVFHYHSSAIAEFLNRLRWDIYRYLQPEYASSIITESGDPISYRFTFPSGVDSTYARECYWGLMNEVRSPPYMRPFRVHDGLKEHY